MKLGESIIKGLNEAVEYERGNIKAKRQVIKTVAVPTYKADRIKKIRAKTGLSQAVFSNVLGVSVKTVEAWEGGRNIPSGTAQRLLAIIDKDPEIIRKHILR
ncbi:MAG: type II toxin-antitoxin system MqsA family antitoxin [Clostridia bacterium]|nr:type II toxin-antitoxin system MqsA family antitoxin [Clostridia bacterium]MBS3970482.1 type II toxin-antitoxin system MqsA family antitoxin [Clostridia bacterium]